MSDRRTVAPYDNVDVSNYIDLRRFAPKLRKLGKYLLKSDQPVTIKAACKELKLNYESVCTLIWKEKRKGNDFHKFIREHSQSLLEANRIAVYQATIDGAVSQSSTSHNDRKTYFQLAGDLKEQAVNTSISLTIGVAAPVQVVETDREKGEIDIEPILDEDATK
jgi:hypothetical protein